MRFKEQNTVILNRDKIITIGKNPKTVKLGMFTKDSNLMINSFEIYNVIRRKKKIIAYCLNGKVELEFNTIENAENLKKRIKKALK